jgi:hypothetical protein
MKFRVVPRIAGLTDESVCPTTMRQGLRCGGAGAFACQPVFSQLLMKRFRAKRVSKRYPRWHIAIPLLALVPAALFAQSAPMDELLAQGRNRILQTISHLVRYTCTQTVDRSESRQVQPHLPQNSCDQIMANRRNGVSRMELTWTDRLRLEVEITDKGIEIFSWPGASRIASERIKDFSGDGLIGTGSFGPFLSDIFANKGVTFWPEGPVTIDGRSLRQYRYMVPLGSSHYRLVAGRETRVVPFEGRFWLDPESAELRRLLVRLGELSRSTGNCEGATTVDFGRVRIGSGEYLLPSKSLLHVVRRDAVEQENVTTYAACHEFQGESLIHFAEEGDATGSDPLPSGIPKARVSEKVQAFPPGIPVKISFESAIDTSVAAAGDLIAARVRHNDLKLRKRIIPEAGAPARCRLTRLEHSLDSVPEFGVALACEAIQLNAAWIPFAATRDEPAALLRLQQLTHINGNGIRVESEGRRPSARGGTFVFPTNESRYVVSPFTSPWVTVVPEKAAARP